MSTPTSGYINGSDLLLSIGGKAIGHCTSHETSYSSETKERAVKPVASADISASYFTDKSVNKLSVSISFDGLRNYGETEAGFKTLLTAWKAGQTVEVKAFQREDSETPYLTGNFVISGLTESAPANDDASYSGTLESSGVITIKETALQGETNAAS